MTPEEVPDALVEKIVRTRYEAERKVMAGRGVKWPEYDSPLLRQAESNWIEDDKKEAREILAMAWDEITAEGHCCGQ